MSDHNVIATTFLAALLIAGAGPAMAKKQVSGEAVTAQQGNAKSKQAVKYCRRNPPPFMRNPRFMNRGFFKKKCSPPDQ